MGTVTKSSFFRNRAFSAKNKFKMQSYLNYMSANGLHISEIRKSKCRFTEDASVRYIYSICGQGDDALYTEQSGWTHFCNYKGVSFFRRAVPADAVKLVRDYKKKHIKQEHSWLMARLREGLALIGKVGNEYIFGRSDEYKYHEYVIKQIGKPKKAKDGQVISPLGDTFGLTFICENGSGSVYYFIKDAKAKNAIIERRGRRLTDQIMAIFLATGAAIGFCAAAACCVFGLIKGGVFKLPLLIGGAVGGAVFAVLFALSLSKFKKITEARRIYKEEKRLKREADAIYGNPAQSEKISEPQSNTVVMNTVVMNNYGEQNAPIGSNPYEQIFSDPTIMQNPAMAAAQSAMNSVRYGDAADTIIQGQAAPFLPNAYDEVEWTEPEQEEEKDDSFPLTEFILCALLCFASVMAMLLGIRYGIGFFVNFGRENILSLLFSVLGIAFSPFTFRYGFSSCTLMLQENECDEDLD